MRVTEQKHGNKRPPRQNSELRNDGSPRRLTAKRSRDHPRAEHDGNEGDACEDEMHLSRPVDLCPARIVGEDGQQTRRRRPDGEERETGP